MKVNLFCLERVKIQKQVYYYSHLHCLKIICIRRFSGPYFPAFELNTERFFVFIRMCENTDQKNSEYVHLLHSVICEKMDLGLSFKISIIKITNCPTIL